MADINKIIPFIIEFEAGVVAPELSNEELFEKSRKVGFANDPVDAGGATQTGVTLGAYKTYCKLKGIITPTVESLKNIPYSHWFDILKSLYWDKWQADRIENQSIAEILVDWVWASGSYGIKLPQKVLGVTSDGIVGERTLFAVNNTNPRLLFDAIYHERVSYIDRIIISRPANEKFRKGWLRRINAIKFKA